jgi:hypothetical protein
MLMLSGAATGQSAACSAPGQRFLATFTLPEAEPEPEQPAEEEPAADSATADAGKV